jgi:uncharacterized protein (TIGR03437 family)
LSGTYIAVTGNGTAGDASSFLVSNTNYARIDGPSAWIEFACQTGVVFRNQIHYHTVWRDHVRETRLFATGSLASEGIAALFGTGLASGTVSATMTPLPTTLGDAQVQVRDSAGTTRNAPLFYVSPTQINFQIPAGSSAGAATISVLLNGSTVGQGTATIASVAPGLFTANATGKGVPAAVILRVKADGTQTYESLAQYDQTQSAYVATPIDLGASTDQVFLIGYGTGIRNRSALTAVGATIGGTAAVVSYAGASSGFVGLDQVNILIPRSLASRGSVDVVLGVDSSTANTVTINLK